MRPIGPAQEYDIPTIAALNNRYAPDGLTLPRSEAFVLAHLDDYLVVRDDGGRLVGCVCVDEYSPSLAEIVSLAVDPAHQGKGLGTNLILAAVQLAAKRGFPEIFAVSFSDELFKRCGFSFVDIARYPEKKRRYDPVAQEEWTIGLKHCFARQLQPAAAAA